MPVSNYWSDTSRLSRRRVLRGGFAVGAGIAGAALIGCGGENAVPGGNATQAPPAQGAAATPIGAQSRDGMPVVKGTPKKGGTFTMGLEELYVQHDQHTAVSNSEWAIIGERALELEEFTGKLRANIIEKWEIPDNTHFILNVRKGVKIHNKPPWNGRDFDAEDLAFNLNRIAGNTAAEEGLAKGAFQRATTLEGMDKLEVVDKYTVRVTMKQPSSTFLNGITEIRNQMMPKGIVEVGFKDPQKFAGISPFMVGPIQAGARQEFVRNPAYYRPNEPYFDKVVQVVIPDRAALLAAFISKQTSTFSSPTSQEQQTIKAARPDALLYSYGGVNYQFLMPNFNHPAFKDFRVRQAVNLAADREEIGNGYHGSGWQYLAAAHPAFPEAWQVDKVKTLAGWNPATKEKDRAEAAKLMEAAGHKDGAGLAWKQMNKPKADNRENSLRLQAQLTKLFPQIKVELEAPETAVFDKAQSSKEFQSISNDSTMQPDIALESYARFHSKGSRNYGAFANAEADALLEKALAELNVDARKALMETYQTKWVNEWLPMITFYATPVRHFVQPNIGGFDQVLGTWDSGRGITHKQGRIYEV